MKNRTFFLQLFIGIFGSTRFGPFLSLWETLRRKPQSLGAITNTANGAKDTPVVAGHRFAKQSSGFFIDLCRDDSPQNWREVLCSLWLPQLSNCKYKYLVQVLHSHVCPAEGSVQNGVAQYTYII